MTKYIIQRLTFNGDEEAVGIVEANVEDWLTYSTFEEASLHFAAYCSGSHDEYICSSQSHGIAYFYRIVERFVWED